VQDDITDAIVAAIEPQVHAAEHFRAARKPPESLDAWDLVMQALSHFWRVTRDDNIAAQALLERAIVINPDYARALAVLAVSHGFGMHMGWEDMATAVPAAARAAQAAIRADGDDPWAHLATAVGVGYLGQIDDALAAHESALRLNPNFSLALGYYGLTLASVGRWQEGADAARRAQRLSPRDPLSAIYDGVVGYAAFVGGNYDEAVRMTRQAIRQRPDFAAAYRVLTAAAALKGDLDAARAALLELRRAQPNISIAWIARLAHYTRADVRERYLEGFRRAGLE